MGRSLLRRTPRRGLQEAPPISKLDVPAPATVPLARRCATCGRQLICAMCVASQFDLHGPAEMFVFAILHAELRARVMIDHAPAGKVSSETLRRIVQDLCAAHQDIFTEKLGLVSAQIAAIGRLEDLCWGD